MEVLIPAHTASHSSRAQLGGFLLVSLGESCGCSLCPTGLTASMRPLITQWSSLDFPIGGQLGSRRNGVKAAAPLLGSAVLEHHFCCIMPRADWGMAARAPTGGLRGRGLTGLCLNTVCLSALGRFAEAASEVLHSAALRFDGRLERSSSSTRALCFEEGA